MVFTPNRLTTRDDKKRSCGNDDAQIVTRENSDPKQQIFDAKSVAADTAFSHKRDRKRESVIEILMRCKEEHAIRVYV